MGAYENPPFIGIQDPMMIAKAFSNSFEKTLAVFDKINKERQAKQKIEDDRLTYTTGHLLGTIKNIHNASEGTKNNIRRNVDEFSNVVRDEKLNAAQLQDATYSWRNAVGSYNEALSIAYGMKDMPEISKAHPQYEAYTELMTALLGAHDFDSPFDKKTRQFTGTLKYTNIHGVKKVLAAHDISGIMGAITGSGDELGKFEKNYDNTIYKNNSVLRQSLNLAVLKTFNDNKRSRPVNDNEIQKAWNSTYDGIIKTKGEAFEREIWYNKMGEGDKIYTYKDASGNEKTVTLDYNTTDEEYEKIANINGGGLDREETAVYNKIKNAHSKLVKDFVGRQILPGVKTNATRYNKHIVPGKRVEVLQSKAWNIQNALRGNQDKIAFFTKTLTDAQVATIIDVIPQAKDGTMEEKIEAYYEYQVNQINDALQGMGDTNIQYFTRDKALAYYIETRKDEDGFEDELTKYTDTKGKEKSRPVSDKDLEIEFNKEYPKLTGEKANYFYTNDELETAYPIAVTFDSTEDLIKKLTGQVGAKEISIEDAKVRPDIYRYMFHKKFDAGGNYLGEEGSLDI